MHRYRAPRRAAGVHDDPGKNDYLLQLQTNKVKITTKPSRIKEYTRPGFFYESLKKLRRLGT